MVTILDLLKYHKECKVTPKETDYKWRLDCGIYIPIRFMTKCDIQDIQNKINIRLFKAHLPPHLGATGPFVLDEIEIVFCNTWNLRLQNELMKSDRGADSFLVHACSLKHSYRYHWV